MIDRSQKRVLIAEDDAGLRQMLKTLLRQMGVEASEARDGLDAVNQLRENDCDLAIVDLMMPRLDGYVVVRYLEENRPGTHAIIISAVRDDELRELSRSTVVDAVLHKPFDVQELTAMIARSLDR